MFGDGAGSVIVCSDLILGVEKPLFDVVYAAQRPQTILPDSDGVSHLGVVGITLNLLKTVAGLVSKNNEKSLIEAYIEPSQNCGSSQCAYFIRLLFVRFACNF